jgi:hypothetical protein
MMLEKLNQALAGYARDWNELVATRTNKDFFASLQPTAVGWKTTDRAEYTALVAELHDTSDQIIETWMNGRWVAKLHLKDMVLSNGASIVKIMERRPGSTDATGLDHVDLYTATELAWAKDVLGKEPELNWSQESNDIIDGYDWLSVWFAGTEAKIKNDTVLEIVSAELTQLDTKIRGMV